jgi:hypothetical protein
MHKGYKYLDRTTGRVYISRDVIFDEQIFPFATPGVTTDISLLQHVTFPTTEPAIKNTNMRNYDISLLPVDPPGIFPSVVV